MPIYRGGTKVERGQLKIGTQDVKEVYLGATKIWPEALNAALNPVFGASVGNSSGYDVAVTNYDASFSWLVTTTAGAAVIHNSGLVQVTGLAASQSATITVTTSKANHDNGSGSTSGTANAQLNPALNPTFGAFAGIVGGWRVPVANYDSSFTWAVTSTAGFASINSAGLVEVIGLNHSQSSTITVTTSKANHHNGSGSTTGKANDYVPPPPPPELNFDNPSNGGYGGGGTMISYSAMGSGVGNAADCSGSAVIGWDVRHYQGEGHHGGNMIAELVETKTVPCTFTDTGYGVRIEIKGSPSTSLNTCHMEGSSPGGRALRKRVVKATVINPNGTVSTFSSMTNWTTGPLSDCP